MIFTIGYQRLAPDRLSEIVNRLDALLVDVRAKPHSRKAGYGNKQIQARFGEAYIWQGRLLGGPGGGGQTTQDGINWLKAQKRRTLLLMCLEEAPWDCHRHHLICGPHFPNAVHIHQGDMIFARDLTKYLADDKAETYTVRPAHSFIG